MSGTKTQNSACKVGAHRWEMTEGHELMWCGHDEDGGYEPPAWGTCEEAAFSISRRAKDVLN